MNKNMQIKLAVLFCILIWGLSACKGYVAPELENTEELSESESATENETVSMKEVVFLNRIPGMLAFDTAIGEKSGLFHRLDFDEEYEENALFAYRVISEHGPEFYSENGEFLGTSDDSDKVRDILIKEGFYFLKGYDDRYFYIAGTMAQYEKVFRYHETYDGFYLGAVALVRPDMEEILDQKYGAGTFDEIVHRGDYERFDGYFEELIPLLGTDKNRVLCNVLVELPEEKSK